MQVFKDPEASWILGTFPEKKGGVFTVNRYRDASEHTHVFRFYFLCNLEAENPFKKKKAAIPARSIESRCEKQQLLRNM